MRITDLNKLLKLQPIHIMESFRDTFTIAIWLREKSIRKFSDST